MQGGGLNIDKEMEILLTFKNITMPAATVHNMTSGPRILYAEWSRHEFTLPNDHNTSTVDLPLLQIDDSACYEYDANGNAVRKTVGAQVTRYEYNSRNRLSRIYLLDGRVANYTYDPFGRRIKKQVASSTSWYLLVPLCRRKSGW